MTSVELDAFVDEYFASYQAIDTDTRHERASLDIGSQVFWFEAVILSGPEADLEAIWPMLLALIERAPDDAALAYVAAGPLENLIWKWHDRFETRLLEETRRSARFRLAIQGVWGLEDLPQSFRNRLISLAGIPIASASSPDPKRGRVRRRHRPGLEGRS